MDISLFLAKYLGLYLLIIALIWILRKNQFEIYIKYVLTSPGLLALSGALSLLFGLAIVIVHPQWPLSWESAITFIGYLSIFKGILRLGFPMQIQSKALVMIQHWSWLIIVIIAGLGAYLTYHGFS